MQEIISPGGRNSRVPRSVVRVLEEPDGGHCPQLDHPRRRAGRRSSHLPRRISSQLGKELF